MPRLSRLPHVKRKAIPVDVRHEWSRSATRGAGVYECRHCQQWTANLPLYRDDVCPARNRRKARERRRD